MFVPLLAPVLLLLLHTCNAHSDLQMLVVPSSQTVPVNTTTSFFCSAYAFYMRWFINGFQLNLRYERQTYADKGITFSGTTEFSPEGLTGVHRFNRTITVVASVAINTTNFTCVAYVHANGSSVSATAQLIVVDEIPTTKVAETTEAITATADEIPTTKVAETITAATAETVTTEDGNLSLLMVVIPPVAVPFILIIVAILTLITVILLYRKHKYKSRRTSISSCKQEKVV